MFPSPFPSKKEFYTLSLQLPRPPLQRAYVVKNHLVFDEQISSTIPKKLILGDYVSFLADIEFKNVQFLNIFELDGVSV